MLAPTPTKPVKTWTVWDDERCAVLRYFVARGLSGAEIGAEMEISRCAVLGKAARLGLVVGGGQPMANPDRQARRLEGQRRRREGLPHRHTPHSPKALHRPALVQCKGYTDIPPDHSDCAVPFLEIREGQCRYPVSADGQPFLFCAAPATETYCPRHDRLCHRYTGPARSWHEGRRERAG